MHQGSHLQIIFSLLSDYSDEDPKELLADEDTRPRVTSESIITNLFHVLFGENNYGQSKYWEDRYKEKDEQYEWFLSWDSIYPSIKDHLSQHVEKCLNLGCGNSPMCVDMLNCGICSVVNIDISQTVINQMRNRYKDQRLSWHAMDCRNLTFAENEFDMVIDKGTIDALYCMENPADNIQKTVQQISNVLIPTKKYICISFGTPDQRKEFIDIAKKYFTFTESICIKNDDFPNKVYHAYIFCK